MPPRIRFPRPQIIEIITKSRRDVRADYLALVLTAVVLRSEMLHRNHNPLGWFIEDRLAWLRVTLRPLARRSPVIAEVLPLLQDDAYIWYLDQPHRLRAFLPTLAALARAWSSIEPTQRSKRRVRR